MALLLDREWTLPLLHFLKSIPPGKAVEEGKRLARRGPLHSLRRSIERKCFTATVAGEGDAPHVLTLTLEGGRVHPACDCKEGPGCRHGYAAALVLLGEAYHRGSHYRDEIRPLLPSFWKHTGNAQPARTFAAVERIFETMRSLPAGASESIAGAPSPQPAALPVTPPRPKPTPKSAKPLGPSGRAVPPDQTTGGPPLQVIWSLLEDAPSEVPVAAWQLRLRQAGQPERLLSATQMRRLRDVLESKYPMRNHHDLELLKWLLMKSEMQPADIPGIPERKTTFRVISASHWLVSWGGTRRLWWDSHEPVRDGQHAATLAIDEDERGELIWAMAFPPPDGPAASITLEPLAGTTLFLDATSAASRSVILARRGGLVYPVALGELPLDVLLSLRKAHYVRWEDIQAIQHGPALVRQRLEELARRSGKGRRNPWIRILPVRPVIELRHKRDSWLTLAVYARAHEGEIFLRDGEGAWNAVTDPDLAASWRRQTPFGNDEMMETIPNVIVSPAQAVRDDSETTAGAQAAPLLNLPDPQNLQDTEQWLARMLPLEALPTHHGQGRYVYEWASTDHSVAALRRLWAQRPGGVDYFGNPAFLKLIDRRRRPPLRITSEPAGQDWLWISAELEEELGRLDASSLAALLAAPGGDTLIRLPDGRAYEREGLEELLKELELLEGLGLRPGEGRQRIHALHLANPDARDQILSRPGSATLAVLGDALRAVLENFTGIPSAPVEEATAAHLRPYQRAGVDFLVWAARALGGALLADDMGLGKTLQMLAALTALRRLEPEPLPSLVLCPASVTANWAREVRRFCPNLNPVVLEAGAGRRAQLESLGPGDLAITNYALARRDAALLAQRQWLAVCADEAQAIKNAQSETATAVRALPARYRFALTGTPIENRLEELLAIAGFASPGHLAVRPEELRDPVARAGLTRRLRARLRPLLLRRLKREVAPELPDRIEERIDCELTENQRRLYLAEVARARGLLDGLGGPGPAAGQARMQIFAALVRLRQLCCDPALLVGDAAGSGKVEELMDLLPVLLEAGHKVLVFSQFVGMLEILERRAAALGVPVYKLTGQTKKRQELVDRFERDPSPAVFLISLKAGGSGLNLTSASHVVIFDPWWNPAVEAQAIDRAHRIGQDKTVVAFRLVARGTIEERIMDLQEKKRELVASVLDDEAFGRALSREDLEYLLD